MAGLSKALSPAALSLSVAFLLLMSGQKTDAQQRGPANAPAGGNAPSSIPMGIGDPLLRHQQGAWQGR